MESHIKCSICQGAGRKRRPDPQGNIISIICAWCDGKGYLEVEEIELD